jgi:hypothetical protein
LIASVLSLAIVYLVLWMRMINSHAERTGTDFIGFYTAARIAQTEGRQFIYIPELQQRMEEDLVGFELAPGQVLLFNHLPYLVPLISLIVNENYIASLIRWNVILLALYGLVIYLIGSKFRKSILNDKESLILGVGLLLFFPFFVSLLNGQDTVFLLLGAALLWIGLLDEKPVISGIGLSLMTIRPQMALIMAIPFFFYNRRIFWWFLIGSFCLGLFVLVYLGLDGTSHFINILLTSSRGDWYGLHPEDMPTLTGLLHRNFPDLSSNTIQIAGMAGYLGAMAGLSLGWRKRKTITVDQIGIFFLVGIFFVPYLHYHDLTLLIIPILCLLQLHVLHKKKLVLIPLVLSFILIMGFFWEPIKYLTVSISMLSLTALLWIPVNQKIDQNTTNE